MEKDSDVKLYNGYLKIEEEEIELLYNKYKDKIKYFINNIINDYEKSEDITQEVFIYILQNQVKKNSNLKTYMYLIARHKAYNYINVEKRREEINNQYLYNGEEQLVQDVAEIVAKNEKQKEILDAINMLDDKYKNVLYLIKIEELSYQDTAKILGEKLQNVKNLVHRGKKELRKNLIKKGFDESKNIMKIIVIVLLITVLLSGGVYAVKKIIENLNVKVEMTPTFTSGISTMDTNKVWVGTFNLVWNDFMNDVVKGKIEFEDGESSLANELNKQTFTVDELSENSYFKLHGKTSYDLKYKIENGIKEKFNEESIIIDKANWDDPNGYILYAMLKKEFEFLEVFPNPTPYFNGSFNNSEKKVRYFGIDPSTSQEASKNVEILFYNSVDDFAVKLKTKQGEEVYLYKTTGENKSFEENYQEMQEKENEYTGEKIFQEHVDELRIPFISISDEINYDELCGRFIKGTEWWIRQALQTIDFELNNVGGSIKSEALIDATRQGGSMLGDKRTLIFNSDFILYLKEENKDKPYFALKVDDIDVLVEGKNE